VTAVEDVYCRLLVSAQLVVREMYQYQICDGIDLQIEITPSPYVTSAMFESYIDSVLIPAVESESRITWPPKETSYPLL
jgi:hypothetical protein